jgi:hypothetical protein|tara:strand:+ start:700 stop:933 length:234 start_codon:yes stop_codon:yes gene_type:complete
MENPMTLRNINLAFELGQQILVGNSKKPAKITKIEYHEKSGEVVLGTTRGTRKALTFSLMNNSSLDDNEVCLADKYR